MPCNSDYMSATYKEKLMSRVACLLDELKGKPINKSYWDGYHPKIYSKSYDADALVAELCSKLQNLDVSKQSLEMQMWWRDHKRADKKRIERELKESKDAEARDKAIAKLTQYERELLGV